MKSENQDPLFLSRRRLLQVGGAMLFDACDRMGGGRNVKKRWPMMWLP